VVGSGDDCNHNGTPDECEEDCNGKGTPDGCDLGHGTSQDCNGNFVPDECDIASGFSADANLNGVPDECEVSCCVAGGKEQPRVLVTKYKGDDCTATSNSQEPGSVTCEDYAPLAGRVFIEAVNNAPDEDVWFTGEVDPGEVFVIDATNAGGDALGAETCIRTFDMEGGTLLQVTCFQTSCLEKLVPGDQFGAHQFLRCKLPSAPIIPDCNGNGVPDDIELDLGTGLDCNSSGVLDECDIADGTSGDCNRNGVPDECDIASGTSRDANGNGVPDECNKTPCPYDCGDGNGSVDLTDFVALLAQWDLVGTSCDPGGDGIDISDFLGLLAALGPCP
jgi:hypothetical protein